MGVKISTRWSCWEESAVLYLTGSLGAWNLYCLLACPFQSEILPSSPGRGVVLGRMLSSGTPSLSPFPRSSSAPVFLESLLPPGSSHRAVSDFVCWAMAFVSRSLWSWSASGRLAAFVNLESPLHSSSPSLLPEACWPQGLIWRGKWETHFSLKVKPSSRLQACIVQHGKYREYFVITVNRA